jgi:RNA polymerase sigma-70 factor (ECF subfamily)
MQKQFEGRSKFSTYFYRIVYNTAVDSYKKNKLKKFNIVSIDISEPNFREGDELTKGFYEKHIDINKMFEGRGFNPDNAVSEKEIQDIVNSYISSIPEHYSVMLNMYYLNDLSHNEISDILKIPIGTVKNRIFRAKEKLKDIILEKYSKDEILEYV